MVVVIADFLVMKRAQAGSWRGWRTNLMLLNLTGMSVGMLLAKAPPLLSMYLKYMEFRDFVPKRPGQYFPGAL
jgi:hypothetical protein